MKMAAAKAPLKVATAKPIKIAAPKPVKVASTPKSLPTASPHISDRWPTEVRQESRRITGVTPKLLGAYQESPARFIKRTSSLRVQAGQKKVAGKAAL